ncbi:MAG: hypothetical protein WA960_07605 [Tunicatimonas sp.]
MTTKLTLWMALSIFCLAVGFSGCQSSKIAYGNSYYFKQTPRPVAPPTAKETDNLKASLEKQGLTEQSLTAKMEEAREQLDEAVTKSENSAFQASVARTKQLAREMKGEQLTRKEVRGKRKELRQELRTLAKEFKNASPEETKAIDRNLKLAIIFLGVALILSILAGSTPGYGVLGLLATIAIIVSVVFFVLWLLEVA